MRFAAPVRIFQDFHPQRGRISPISTTYRNPRSRASASETRLRRHWSSPRPIVTRDPGRARKRKHGPYRRQEKPHALFLAICRKLPVKFRFDCRKSSADMLKREKPASKAKKALDTISWKRGRGRPGVRPSGVSGRSYHYRLIFRQIWERLREPLLTATTDEDVTRVLEGFGTPYSREFAPTLSPLILQVIREPRFPKGPEAQMGFLADSLAGRGWISPRRSRDICQRERIMSKKEHCIIRQDYYIECTCGYKGPGLYGKCPKCGTDRLSPPLLLSDD